MRHHATALLIVARMQAQRIAARMAIDAAIRATAELQRASVRLASIIAHSEHSSREADAIVDLVDESMRLLGSADNRLQRITDSVTGNQLGALEGLFLLKEESQ